MLNNQQIAKLLFLHIRKELTPSQESVLKEWRSVSVENENLFIEITDPENLKKELKVMNFNKKNVWNKIVKKCPELKDIDAPVKR